MRALLALVALGSLAACVHARAVGEMDRAGFVDVVSVVPGLIVDMRYYGSENFVGRRIAGYEASVCLLTSQAAAALKDAQARLQPFGLGLKLFDCYRPRRAVADFVSWGKDLSDQKRKQEQYPRIDKARLFELGYIAERSGHSRGSTLDLTVIDLRTQAELDMGGPYDLFDTQSWPTDQSVGPAARANRLILQQVMGSAGFKPLGEEWWHFTLRDEPFPETYFDFPVTPDGRVNRP
ncbi:MAG: M15 family metallopeptidase [Hyphomonadaceae bacterium]